MNENVRNIDDYRLKLKYDGPVSIATGKGRFEKNWKNKQMQWSTLVAKLAKPIRTQESYAEYKKMNKTDQDRIKDVGGYVGGHLKDGRRKSDSVICRQIITLDLDFAPIDFFETIEMLSDYACVCYSTHKHSINTPRFRLLIPLDREVSPDEYEAIARMMANDINMDYFDDTTYQPSRLMYWPSCSQDGNYFYRYLDNPFLKADDILNRYDDWTDISFWPESSRAAVQRKKRADKQGDPCEKKGLIGAFCRTYTVPEAIESFIPQAYIRCANSDRYTYAGGSTAAGLVIYEDEKFAYSNHGTDPASGLLCNAFDLVRIHKFGELDDESSVTEPTKLPSYKAMLEMIQNDKNTKMTLNTERMESAKEEFTDNENWVSELEIDKKGNIQPTLHNLELIFNYDESLKAIRFNQLSDGMEIQGNPWKHPSKNWRDADDAQLEMYLMKNYGTEFPKTKIYTAITKVTDDRSYHPVREFIEELPEWDETERVDSLFIDYLGAEDSDYTRAVTRKTLCGAIARITNPGCKFDTMLVLCGATGIGKSTIISKLGGEWFSDNLSLSETKDKTAAEKIQGYWIIEIGELAGLRKTDIETLKSFISRQDDKYRAAYGRRVTSHKRQCIFIGTTNAEDGYLRDVTGNRRFWPVNTPGGGTKKAWNLTTEDIKQIWAEVKHYYDNGESLILDERLNEVAKEKQLEAMEHDEREGLIKKYLDTLLPDNWDKLNVYQRRAYIENEDGEQDVNPGIYERDTVCYMELWCEALGKNKSDYKPKDGYELAAIMKVISDWERSRDVQRVGSYGPQRLYKRI